MAATVKRFDFTALQDFREPPKPLEIVTDNTVEEAEPVPPPPPTFSESEMEAAKHKAFDEGRNAGLQEGKERADTEEAQRLKAIEKSLERFAAQAESIPQRHTLALDAYAAEIAQLACAAARQLAGDAIQAQPMAGIEAMLRECLNILLHQPRARLAVHPTLEEPVAEFTRSLLARRGSDCDLQVQGDESIPPGDARLEWRDGMAERDTATIWQRIEAQLKAVDFARGADSCHSELSEESGKTT